MSARVLERSATSVKNCIKRINLTQNCGYLKGKNSGRKLIVDDCSERLILRKIKANPMIRIMLKRLLATKSHLITYLHQHVLWTDESSISTDSYEKVRVWCHKDELYDPIAHKQPLKVVENLLWSGDVEKYGNIILDVIYPMVMVAEEAIFQEDNAPIHKSKPVKELKDNLGINRIPQTETDLEKAVFAA
ncbi:11704_t:CDS:2 [Ambispora gerdemannii]|uniref:11704_t:CDS:1 n=1 Tax=Ambispora gerdemannii TaxID=144530 RepID=A0A9N9C491_9GLOM|nr:11704_t:CDS:2 [Ambispora gerdemannii]